MFQELACPPELAPAATSPSSSSRAFLSISLRSFWRSCWYWLCSAFRRWEWFEACLEEYTSSDRQAWLQTQILVKLQRRSTSWKIGYLSSRKSTAGLCLSMKTEYVNSSRAKYKTEIEILTWPNRFTFLLVEVRWPTAAGHEMLAVALDSQVVLLVDCPHLLLRCKTNHTWKYNRERNIIAKYDNKSGDKWNKTAEGEFNSFLLVTGRCKRTGRQTEALSNKEFLKY